AILQGDAPAELVQGVLTDAACHPDPVDFGDLVPGVEEPLRQAPLVGEEEQALALPVQAAHGVEPGGPVGHQVKDGLGRVGISDRGDDAPGFVEHQVDQGFRGTQGLAIHLDPGSGRVDPLAQAGRPAVHPDPARREPRPARARTFWSRSPPAAEAPAGGPSWGGRRPWPWEGMDRWDEGARFWLAWFRGGRRRGKGMATTLGGSWGLHSPRVYLRGPGG